MIYYFSATGNSQKMAEFIAQKTGEELFSLNDCLKNKVQPKEAERYLFVVPTYAWRIPCIVSDYLLHSSIGEGKDVWFVMTCGGEIGNAERTIRSLCKRKKWQYKGVLSLLLPDNYLVMFPSADKEKGKAQFADAYRKLEEYIPYIREGKDFPKPRSNLYDRAMSGLVNPIFYRFVVKAKGFYATDACLSCGKCEKVCPLNNIHLADGKPVWGTDCTHCLACLNLCPVACIEYKNKTKGKERYSADKILK